MLIALSENVLIFIYLYPFHGKLNSPEVVQRQFSNWNVGLTVFMTQSSHENMFYEFMFNNCSWFIVLTGNFLVYLS